MESPTPAWPMLRSGVTSPGRIPHKRYCDVRGLSNVDSRRSLPFTVYNYYPAGNSVGEYSDNVLAPRGDAVYIVKI